MTSRRAALVDLSHRIEDGMITYPGLPGPEISMHLTFEESHGVYAPGTEFAIARIAMVGNTGTYLDTSAHRYRDGHDLADLRLDHCANLPLVVIDADGAIGAVGAEAVRDVADLRGAVVLFRTGWDVHWGTPRYGAPEHPFVTAGAATALVEAGAALVGIDSVNIDATDGGERPSHSVLLAAEIPVVEHLTNLDRVPASGGRFFAVPPAVRRLATFPVRAFALLPG